MTGAGVELVDRRWDGLAEGAVVLVPVGSTEQHGPHLPYDTDTVIAQAVAGRMARRLAGAAVLVAPALAFGASGEHQEFPGTVSIGTDALRLVLVEMGRSLCTWAGRVVFVNGHGGNVEALAGAVSLLAAEGRDVGWVPCGVPGGDAHAGRTETSVMLCLAPGRVSLERAAAGRTDPIAALMPQLRADGTRAVSPNGVLGDPAGATADEGERLLDRMTTTALARLERAVGRLR